ncbi:MAG: phenylalanine--tRNA ligase subunit beta [Desulfuromonas sp.]|nr:MAG: phenylalanine--tRNA ligase subunit beta [Desulfuromonas sp.]
MVVTYNWLKEFVDFDLSPEELSHRLTMAGLEVDAMEKTGAGLESVVVAHLLSVERHPDADRLTVCRVNAGAEELQIVCGATNHKTGDYVALARVGTVLPGDFKIKKSKIRGQVSEGMLCSEKELGLSEEASGIMILPNDLNVGQPFFEATGLADVRYEIGLTPNRADCLSVVGVAREVAAMVGQPLQIPQPVVKEEGGPIEQETSVDIVDADKGPRYMARLIKGVEIGPSPDWLVRRLESVGVRAINNVVDITNYVMMELGHPLHAFDFSLLRGQKIIVRCPGETKFTTLDDQEHQLIGSDLAICDAESPVALAGIMGGQNSEIQPNTTDVLLESAYFEPVSIRRTSKRLGIHSESSHRFERGADVNMVPIALDRAASLIAELAGGKVAKGAIDAYPKEISEKQVSITLEKTNRLLGLNLNLDQIASMLGSIGLDIVKDASADSLSVVIPTFRPDLEREVDLIEEIARLNGYDNIPVTMPSGESVDHPASEHQAVVRRLREVMVADGFSEVINYSFISPTAYDQINLSADDARRENVAVMNPLTEEQSVMRTSLLPSLLENVVRNHSYRSLDLSLFEIRPVFRPVENEELPYEPTFISGVMSGRREPFGWSQVGDAFDFYDLKGIVESLLAAARIEDISWRVDQSEPYLHPGKSCSVYSAEIRLGVLGEIHPNVLDNYDLKDAVYAFELDVEELIKASTGRISFSQISRFPDVFRDSAFLFDDEISAEKILTTINSARGKLVESVNLFDVYRGKGVPEDKKSIAIRVRYRSSERTLTDEEINKAHNRIVKTIEKQLGAQLR